VRELGWRGVLKARKSNEAPDVRVFNLPKLKFEAVQYTDMIAWQECNITEPPVTRHLDTAEIERYIETGDISQEIPIFPCHTQAVERLIKLVTDASSAVSGESARDGYIRSRIYSRSKIPRFNTKSDFKL
jgi:hypothetical protein